MPELTLGWRLKMALGDMKRDDMAALLGVNPATVSRWCADKGAAPKRAYIIQWAMATGVSAEWLEAGLTAQPVPPTPPGGGLGINTEAVERLAAQKRARSGATRDNRRYDVEPDAA